MEQEEFAEFAKEILTKRGSMKEECKTVLPANGELSKQGLEAAMQVYNGAGFFTASDLEDAIKAYLPFHPQPQAQELPMNAYEALQLARSLCNPFVEWDNETKFKTGKAIDAALAKQTKQGG